MTDPGPRKTPNKFQADDEISMDVVWRLLSWAWQKKFLLLAGFLIGGGIGLVNALTTPKSYTATVRILPAIDSMSSFMLPGLSAFGMGAGMAPTYEPIFEEIIFSDSIIDRVLQKNWISKSGDEVQLPELFSVEPDSDDDIDIQKSRARFKEVFRSSAISFKRDQFTGYMELMVEIPRDPVVAAGVANFIVESLKGVLVQKFDTLAGSRQTFLEKRLHTVSTELLSAEEDLAQFEKSNRNYFNSPVLGREHARLKRDVDVYSVVWAEIQKQIELVQIRNQHSSPRVVVVDQATPPLFPSGPKRRIMVLLGMFLGVVFVVAVLGFLKMFTIARTKVMDPGAA